MVKCQASRQEIRPRIRLVTQESRIALRHMPAKRTTSTIHVNRCCFKVLIQQQIKKFFSFYILPQTVRFCANIMHLCPHSEFDTLLPLLPVGQIIHFMSEVPYAENIPLFYLYFVKITQLLCLTLLAFEWFEFLGMELDQSIFIFIIYKQFIDSLQSTDKNRRQELYFFKLVFIRNKIILDCCLGAKFQIRRRCKRP